jgi:phosphate starvation-inducible PhoH-like protein
MQQSTRKIRPTRREKILEQDSQGRKTKEKFKEMNRPAPIVAKTEKQKKYLAMLNDPSIQMIICLGLHGCGKSFLSASVAADKYVSNEITKIIVARPYVQTGKTSGAKPGSGLEKLYPYVRNVLDPIRKRMGTAAFDIALADGQKGSIEVQELESIRGRSFDEPSWLLLEEAQQSTPEEMLAVITRVGDDCKIVCSGDLNQKDVRGESGLKWLLDFVQRHNIRGVGVVNFDSPADIVRGGLVRDIAIGLMKEGQLRENK